MVVCVGVDAGAFSRALIAAAQDAVTRSATPLSSFDLLSAAWSETVAKHIVGATTALFTTFNSSKST